MGLFTSQPTKCPPWGQWDQETLLQQCLGKVQWERGRYHIHWALIDARYWGWGGNPDTVISQ